MEQAREDYELEMYDKQESLRNKQMVDASNYKKIQRSSLDVFNRNPRPVSQAQNNRMRGSF
jgi:hypothetical protein